MSQQIRVMLCDDSKTTRNLLTGALTADERLQIVYAAENGQDLLSNVDLYEPDVVILDVEMPVMDGIETAAALKERCPSLPIIMFSALTTQGAEATLDALSAGAYDFAVKSSPVANIAEGIEYIRKELLPKVAYWGTFHRQQKRHAPHRRRVRVTTPVQDSRTDRFQAVAIASSIGGPAALSRLVAAIPPNFDLPIFISQHMPPMFTQGLANRLAAHCSCPVSQAEYGEVVVPGHIYLAPGDFHLTFERRADQVLMTLDQGPRVNSCRPAADVMFRSAADVYGSNLLGLVLTGMGNDGCDGAMAIKRAGGVVYIQDEQSSVVWGMPRAVLDAGAADRVLPLEKISQEFKRIHPGIAPVAAAIQ